MSGATDITVLMRVGICNPDPDVMSTALPLHKTVTDGIKIPSGGAS